MIPHEKPTHLGFAATNDENTILIVKEGKINKLVARREVGDDKFNAVLAALANQQSLESIHLILA